MPADNCDRVDVNLPIEELRAQMREDRRFRAACAAMQGALANEAIAKTVNDKTGSAADFQRYIAAASVEHADALLSALDKPVGGQ